MQLAEIQVGDVLTTVRSDIGCVIEVKHSSANPIRFQMKVGKTYQAKPDFFVSKIGTFDPEALKSSLDNRFGSLVQPSSNDGLEDFLLPPHLKAMGLKAGDSIQVRHGGRTLTAIYEGFKPSRPKYPISYSINGKKWKGPVTCIMVKPTH
jgi:hypothetical protein